MEEVNKEKEILRRYIAGVCSPEEKILVESWYLQQIQIDNEELSSVNYEAVKKEIWNDINKKRNIQPSKQRIPQIWIAAASILLILSIGTFLILNKSNPTLIANNDIHPGGNKAILRLSDGKTINLNDLKENEILAQNGIQVKITAEGKLIYKIDSNIANRSNTNGYNTIETPAGGQYQIELIDGTKVWLNSLSSLRYPIQFSKKERLVELKGEAYFEVKHDKNSTFKVASKNQTVTVLGTHFNINCYDDEPHIKTTLVEGSVLIKNKHQVAKVLKPGEQAILNRDLMTIHSVDTDQAIAWHHNDMSFEGTKLSAIMRQISRWYDVEIIYQGAIEDIEFGGSISRDKSIKEVLNVLESTKSVKFKLEGRRIIVMQ